ncbi:phosphate ABC transporter substrate-binding protein [Colwellia hornerae]|uniref:phosphate ABC transporter substrate-binding protein n=2 Tax=Colwellia hornerae TaxID=89402 RepID=UPI001CB965D4|nr:phosphate ABC transporter substrate-binding protein [Colwellia hornerae]
MMKYIKINAILLSTALSFTAIAEVAVIVNPANSSALTDREISRIFLGKNKTFANGASVMAANLKDESAAREEFESKVLKKTSYQVKSYWAKLIFSGKAKPLAEFDSDADVLNFVAANPDAIGYIDAANVSDKVKVIKTFK